MAKNSSHHGMHNSVLLLSQLDGRRRRKLFRLVAALEGKAATNVLQGLSSNQMDSYEGLITRLKNRYDPPDREETYRTEFSARVRRQGESPDAFAETLRVLAQRGFPGYQLGDTAMIQLWLVLEIDSVVDNPTRNWQNSCYVTQTGISMI